MVEDIIFIVRNDPKEYSGVKDLISLNKDFLPFNFLLALLFRAFKLSFIIAQFIVQKEVICSCAVQA